MFVFAFPFGPFRDDLELGLRAATNYSAVIHDTLNIREEGRSLVVRLESQKLDRVTRFQYDPEAGTMKVMDR